MSPSKKKRPGKMAHHAKGGRASGRRIAVRGVPTDPPTAKERARLWAPWRLAYIKASDWEKPKGCVLCALQRRKDGPGNLILDRTSKAYLIMNRFPYINGHLMVVPKRHTSDFARLSPAESGQLMALLGRGLDALGRSFRPHGFNVGMNLGKVAGAGIDEHLHFHIVPRWNGDTNFMPVLADVNVVNDHLETAYETLREALGASKGRRG